MDVIKLATGLMATLAALVLGLLISSANTARSTVVRVSAADTTTFYWSSYGALSVSC